jgi:branched-subunit amino acid transport protein
VTGIWPVILAAAAGVLLPKLLPALLLPERVPPLIATWLQYVPAAMLGAFTALTAAGYALPAARPWLLLAALAVAAAMALRTRRTFVALVAGWAVLAGLHLANLN